jgi:CheY-like chemotaxis protein
MNETNKNDSGQPFKVIMADDDRDDQEMFQEALEETKIPTELTTVDNGQELMDNLKDPKEPNPDIIFLDINMPVKDGKECLEEIKQDKELKDIPTVMYTTSTDARDIEDTYKAGADLYVPKPVSFNKLVLIIKKIFSFKWSDLLRPIRKTFLLRDKDV